MISFNPENYRPFKIGYGKAKTILDNLEAVRRFVADIEADRDQAQKKKNRLTESLAKLVGDGVSKADLVEALKNLGVEAIDDDAAPKAKTPKSKTPSKALPPPKGEKKSRQGKCSVCKENKWLQTIDKCRACFLESKKPKSKKSKKAGRKPPTLEGLVASRRRNTPPPVGTDDSEPNKEKLCKELAELAQAFSYDSIGKLIGDGVARGTIKAWCRKARGETEQAWWPNSKRVEDLWVFLTSWKERDPDIIAGLTKVGGNRGWKDK
jgi:hypothetical protein